jgi:MFS family permease
VAAPFLAVFLLQQMQFSLSTVTTLWVTSQVANAVVLYIWGRLSDRLSNKAILRVALPLYFVCMLGLAFAAIPDARGVTLSMLYVVHVAMGAAAGGIGLATGNMSLKLAPQGQGTAYLAATGLVASVTGGLAPLIGGALAHWFEAVQLSVIVRWSWPGQVGEAAVLEFARHDDRRSARQPRLVRSTDRAAPVSTPYGGEARCGCRATQTAAQREGIGCFPQPNTVSRVRQRGVP